jgi:lipopolysaccharide export system protein LptC
MIRLWHLLRGEPRRRRALVGRWSRFVDLMRFLLPATAVLLIVLIVAWPHLVGDGSGFIVPDRALRDVPADPMRMHAPRYVGHSRGDQPYEVTASSAILDPAAPDIVYLDALEAELADNDRDLAFKALSGIYHREARALELSGGIDVRSSDGFAFHTESAKVDLDAGRVVGTQAVEGDGPPGRLSAGSFIFEEGGRVLHFEGRVKAIFHAATPEPASPPQEPGENGT